MAKSVIKRLPKVLLVQFKLMIKNMLEYRVNVFFDIVLRLAEFAAYFLLWQALLFQTNQSFQGWGPNEFILMYVFLQFFTGFIVIFTYPFITLSREIIGGQLDVMLTKPAVSWLMTSLKEMNFPFMNFVVGILGIAYLLLTGYPLVTIKWLLIIPMIVGSFLIASLFSLCLASTTFWVGRMDDIYAIFDSFWYFGNYPSTTFGPKVQSIIAFTMPFLFVHTAPILFILGQISLETFLFLLLIEVGVIWSLMIAFYLLWKGGLKRYESLRG